MPKAPLPATTGRNPDRLSEGRSAPRLSVGCLELRQYPEALPVELLDGHQRGSGLPDSGLNLRFPDPLRGRRLAPWSAVAPDSIQPLRRVRFPGVADQDEIRGPFQDFDDAGDPGFPPPGGDLDGAPDEIIRERSGVALVT